MYKPSNNHVLCVGQSKNRPLIHKALTVLDVIDFVYFSCIWLQKHILLLQTLVCFEYPRVISTHAKTGAALTVLASVPKSFPSDRCTSS